MKIYNRLFNFSVIFLLFTTIGVFSANGQQTPSSDSLNIFNNITDIDKQVQIINEYTNERSTPIVIPPPTDTIKKKNATNGVLHPLHPDSVIVQPVRFVYPKVSLDSIYKRSEIGTLQLPQFAYNPESLAGMTFRDTIFYNPLFLPMIFTGIKDLDDQILYPNVKESQQEHLLIPFDETFAPLLQHAEFIEDVRHGYFKKYPDRMKLSASEFAGLPKASEVEKDVLGTFNPFGKPLDAQSGVVLVAPEVETVKIGRRYWNVVGEHSLQFTQNLFSDNWYRGKNNNLNINSNHVVRANYRKEKIRFDNTLEWRLSLFNSPDDSIRAYKIGNDLLRYYGSLGVDAFLKKWQYSSNVEVKTQMFNNYPVNSNELRSSILAPLYVNAGVGMTYQLNKSYEKVRHRSLYLKLDLSPVSVNYRYVGNPNVPVIRYGIEEGKKGKMELGSTVTADWRFNFNKYTRWESRFKYFTSYKNVVAEFENTLNMDLTNYFSTRLHLNLRYDDSVPKDPKLGYLQAYESVTFGLNFRW
ncbi:MAG: DUF3078 domain-containing protein [Dysgonamonadaceae bacterium]|nr:DUF3078 domain-containing protein [Dysgonamonadaceae bacterium]MDD3308627.1 DUF3078 domain-containing protein [Dysgonamonadaceae bacterium]MDD3901271.1 DUF3078 domain-containing protein [Dysgonamonadaceae bacterium]MDD4398266.1 DUF3078 domain-containing protein [Dysgonamonadaceae bacterium]MEA5080682.1 DUF3078 domain-containing protein [Dysgonamonadaceae bacterium]